MMNVDGRFVGGAIFEVNLLTNVVGDFNAESVFLMLNVQNSGSGIWIKREC